MSFAQRVIELMLLKRGPQDMPGDNNTLYGCAAAYTILLFVQAALIMPAAAAGVQAVVATALLALYVRALLHWREAANRLAQTLVALFSTGAVLSLVMLAPTSAMADYIRAVGEAGNPQEVAMPNTLVTFAYVLLGIWGLAIASHIYRHALDTKMLLGVGAALGFEMLVLVIFSLIG